MSTQTRPERPFAFTQYVSDDGGSKCPVSHAFDVESDDDINVRFGDRPQERTGLFRVLSEYDDHVHEHEEYDPWFVPEDDAKAAWLAAIGKVDDEGYNTNLAVEVAEELGWI